MGKAYDKNRNMFSFFFEDGQIFNYMGFEQNELCHIKNADI